MPEVKMDGIFVVVDLGFEGEYLGPYSIISLHMTV